MRSLRVWWRRLANVIDGDRRDRELAGELESHLELHIEDNLRTGMTRAEARRQALLALGGLDQTKERYRDRRGIPFVETLVQDLRYGARMLQRNPGFTIVAVLTLAIGIGATTALYTVVDAILLRRLPFTDPDRLMRVSLTLPRTSGQPGSDSLPWSYPKYQRFRSLQQVFGETAVYSSGPFTAQTLTGASEPERLQIEIVSAGYFPVLGAVAAIGRTFQPYEDETPQTHFVALLSDGLWRRGFGADPNIPGRTIELDGRTHTIVGVMPPDFAALSGPIDLWLPAHTLPATQLANPGSYNWDLIARLKPDVSALQAQPAVTAIGATIDQLDPSPVPGERWGAAARTLDEIRADPIVRRSVLVLFGATAFILLIACTNIANLLMVRGRRRRRELAIRLAIGAGYPRLARQLLTESVLLALCGAAASLVVAFGGVALLTSFTTGTASLFGRRLSGLTANGINAIAFDERALLFATSIAVMTGVLFGLAPVFQARRAEVTDWLKRANAQGDGGGRRTAGKRFLVIAEVALALVLLVGAGLMIKSFERLTAVSIGADPRNVLTFRLTLPPGPAAGAGPFVTDLQDRLAALPGVLSVGTSDCPPVTISCNSTRVFQGIAPTPRGAEPRVGSRVVSPGFFATLNIPVVAGRGFSTADGPDALRVAVINETAARRLWPGQDPLGKRIGIGMNGFSKDVAIIGVIGDVRHGRPEDLPTPDVYVSSLQAGSRNLFVFARTAGNPLAYAAPLRQAIKALNPNLPVYEMTTMETRVAEASVRSRFSAIVFGLFGAIALVLAAIGIYGVMAATVAERTREIGIRLALGAQQQEVLRMVVRQAGTVVAVGIVVGVGAALVSTRVLATLLYDVTPADPGTYVTIASLLTGVAFLATWLPARRAARVDPTIAMRTE